MSARLCHSPARESKLTTRHAGLCYNPGKMVDVLVIVVSYNVRDLLRECLQSVLASAGCRVQVCVVDNASSDQSAEMVAKEFPQVDLIASPVNGGFSYANNLALRKYGVIAGSRDAAPGANQRVARYVLLLNPDTTVSPNSLHDLARYLDAQPAVGVVGPKILRPDGRLDLACRRSFPTPEIAFYHMLGLSRLFPHSHRFGRYNLTYLDPDQPAEVDSVMGACMMVRPTAIEQAGLLDETFFLYGEDLDWALRIKERGWQVMYYPQVAVLHHKGESSRRDNERALREFYRSMLIFYRKHYAPKSFFLLNWVIVASIYVWGTVAYVRNQLRPKELRRVSW